MSSETKLTRILVNLHIASIASVLPSFSNKMVLGESKMDGNIPDRNTNAQLNSLLKIINTMVELSGKVEIKETQVFDEKNIMKSIFKEMTAKKSMMEDGSNK